MKCTLADVRQSRLPGIIGVVSGNTPAIAASVNAAQSRLVEAGGETGWWGQWVKVVFNVNPSDPYITLPREFCRIINLAVCLEAIRVHNEFYEVMPAGVGLKGPLNVPDWCGQDIAGYERTGVPTMVTPEEGMLLRAYPSSVQDVGKKMLITATDVNDLDIYAPDGSKGFYLTLASPFVTTAFAVNTISAIQKDVTVGSVLFKSVDPVSGVETTLSRYAPTEINPEYRRYYITRLPSNCCPSSTGGTVTVTAICKRECLPVYIDTDQLLIQNIEALVEECHAIKLAESETEAALKQSEYHHAKAIKLLQNQLRHYEGEQQPAVTVDRFCNSPLSRQMIGQLI